MKAQHTPGPWHYNEGAKNVVNWSPETHASLRFPMEINLRLVSGLWNKEKSDEAEANARLIALAPDMAGLLKDSLQLAKLTGPNLEVFARTFAALAETLLNKL